MYLFVSFIYGIINFYSCIIQIIPYFKVIIDNYFTNLTKHISMRFLNFFLGRSSLNYSYDIIHEIPIILICICINNFDEKHEKKT